MLSASSLLTKVIRLKREAIANKPVDPLACLTGDQRRYLEKWIKKFLAEKSENAGGFYAALLEQKHWTPFDWFPLPMVTENMSDDDAGYLWNDFRDGVR